MSNQNNSPQMRSHTNLTWDKIRAKNLKVGDKLFWRHKKYNDYVGKVEENKLIKIVTIRAVNNVEIKTDFGDYNRDTGLNMFEACGCKRFCDCYGKLFFMEK